jgi:hypothetical protein
VQAYGSDRLRQEGERWILVSRLDKGWTPRVEKTHTTAEFPGTTVLWEEQYWEVALAEHLQQGGVRYILDPWRENLAMRVVEHYDAPSEALRVEEHRKKLVREKQRLSAKFLAMIVGHFPALVQNEMASELGLLPTRITLMSVLSSYVVAAALVLFGVSRYMTNDRAAISILAIPLAVETSIRFFIVLTQSRPIGSVVGWIGYSIYYAITKHGPSPFAVEKGWAVKSTEAPPDVALQDAFTMREPFMTFLTPAEQQRIAARFPYDYRRESTKVAAVVLIGSLVGLASSFYTGAIISAMAASALAFEQIIRMMSFRRGPAASVLRFITRPLVRKFL